jgi:formylmethanofuran dehydrogenase subunit E
MISLLSAHGSAESAKPSMDRIELLKQMPINLQLDDTDTVQCSRCEERTPEAEVQSVGSWWLCGICYDDI